MTILAETVHAVALSLFVATLAGIVYLALANIAAIAFRRRPSPHASDWQPSISVLKPVYGMEPQLYENLASFCDQAYPDFEVIFCLHDRSDPALPTVERIAREFGTGNVRVVVGDAVSMRNPKIANLAKACASARGEILAIADADIRVGPEYLAALAASFASERVGAATCLYAATTAGSTVAQLGAAYIVEQFAPSVLVALTLGPLRFCLGATMAVRREVLQAIGGIEALGDFLADDYKLGELVARLGFEVELSRYVVRTSLAETSLRELWAHELRWAHTQFVLAPVGYVFSFITYAVPLAGLYVLVSWNLSWGLPLFAIALALRLTLQHNARAALDAPGRSSPWLIVIRDGLSLGLWATSLFTRRVRWRDRDIGVTEGGRIDGKTT